MPSRLTAGEQSSRLMQGNPLDLLHRYPLITGQVKEHTLFMNTNGKFHKNIQSNKGIMALMVLWNICK